MGWWRQSIGNAENDNVNCLNSKSEYQNPKQIQNPNVRNKHQIEDSKPNVAQECFGH